MDQRENFEAKKAHYMDRLWKKAEEFSDLRVKLQKEADNLYIRVQAKDVDATGLHAKDLIRELQDRYYRTLKEIEEVKLNENELQRAIESLDTGSWDEEVIVNLLGKEDGPKLSKRRQRILEERQRTGVDPRSGDLVNDPYGFKIDTYIVRQQGVGSNKLTTGKRGKGIKGNLGSGTMDAKSIERRFYESTQDTHGGKVKYGKDGQSFVSKSGKKIRKW